MSINFISINDKVSVEFLDWNDKWHARDLSIEEAEQLQANLKRAITAAEVSRSRSPWPTGTLLELNEPENRHWQGVLVRSADDQLKRGTRLSVMLVETHNGYGPGYRTSVPVAWLTPLVKETS